MPRPTPKTASQGDELKKPVTIFIVLAVLFSLAYLYISGLPLYVIVGLAVVVLMVAGHMIARANGLVGGYGVYLTGTQRGIKLIIWLSERRKTFWELLTQWALVMSFGLLSYPLFKKQIGKRMFVFSMVTLVLINFLILPWTSIAIGIINIPQITSRIQLPVPGVPVPLFGFGQLVEDVVTIIGGYSLYVIAAISLVGAVDLYGMVHAAVYIATGVHNPVPLSDLIPGVALLIPGVTLPLAAGLAALILLLIIHEFSHGILASMMKIRLKMIGLILFGIIPVGAFVEPDEKKVTKLDKASQNRIFIAGIGSNLLLSVLFAIPAIAMFLYVLPHYVTTNMVVAYVEPGAPAYNILKPGDVLLYWNNVPVSNYTTLAAQDARDPPNSIVNVTTNKGVYLIRSNASGKVGIGVASAILPLTSMPFYPEVRFIYNFLALSFLLNFLIGAMNLLPIPGFDGWRIYKNVIGDRWLRIFAWALVIVLVILALPWIWIL